MGSVVTKKNALHWGLSFSSESPSLVFLTLAGNIRLVFFDIDGTLIRTGGAGVQAFRHVADELFDCARLVDEMRFAGCTDRGLIETFFEMRALPWGESDVARFQAAYLEMLHQKLEAHPGHICPGVLEFLEQLEGLEEPPVRALLTGNLHRGAELKLGAHGLWDRFEFGAFGDRHADRNHVAEMALEMARQQVGEHLDAGEMLIVGDTPKDVECARFIGAKSLAVATGDYGKEALREAGADWVWENLLQPEVKIDGQPFDGRPGGTTRAKTQENVIYS